VASAFEMSRANLLTIPGRLDEPSLLGQPRTAIIEITEQQDHSAT